MKYFLLVSAFFLSFSFAGDNTTYLKVNGMQCSYSCAGKVSTVVQNIDGVKDCSVDFDKGIAKVTYDDKKVVAGDIVAGLESNTMYKALEVNKKGKKLKISKI
ncbi:MAG: heavy-metal-associated domain-containing protein [Fidelibacterota bacterium]|jgi:copper chaperone CopZ